MNIFFFVPARSLHSSPAGRGPDEFCRGNASRMLEHGTFSARVDLQRRGRRLKHGTLHYAIPAAGWKMPAAGIFVLLLLLLLPSALYAANNADCLACHADKTLQSAAGKSVPVDGDTFHASVHSGLSCTDCHSSVNGFPHPDHPAAVQCATCHADQAKGLKGSVHAAASPGACLSCHGSPHAVFPKDDPRSVVYPLNIPNTCGTCHGGVEDQYLGGAHGKAVASGNMKAPVCTDCHTAHAILQPTLAAFRMQSTPICGSCHQGRFATYGDTFHSQLRLLGGYVQTARCWDCHGAHEILSASDPRSPVAPGNIVLSHPSYARAPPRIPMIRENAPGEIRRVLQQL